MFSLPLRSSRAATQSGIGKTGTRKRKRIDSHALERQSSFDQDSHHSLGHSLNGYDTSPQPSEAPDLTPDEAHQDLRARSPFEEPLPDYPFPHAALPDANDSPRWNEQLPTRSKFDPSYSCTAKPFFETHSLHQQHLAVMMAILHRTLLEEDFVRASRALGIILRDRVGGKSNDIRTDGKWGIGAEILLRSHFEEEESRNSPMNSGTNEERSGSDQQIPKAWASFKGFQAAKAYYEKLIVLYPPNKQFPSTVNALDFYLAMFGLWVYITHQQYNRKPSITSSTTDGSGSEPEGPSPGSPPFSTLRTQSRARYLVVEELAQAREVAKRMDSVMSFVPYRDHLDLINLRRNVRAWIDDLEQDVADLVDTASERSSDS